MFMQVGSTDADILGGECKFPALRTRGRGGGGRARIEPGGQRPAGNLLVGSCCPSEITKNKIIWYNFTLIQLN